MNATDELRRMLDERGVEYNTHGERHGTWYDTPLGGHVYVAENNAGYLHVKSDAMTPEQAIAATLGPRKQPPYDELIEALRRDWDIEASWDGLRRFWYVGLTDEGVRKRDEREATLGRDRYSYGQWREISNAVGDAMEYAHDRAIEHPDAADPLWNLDEYVNRILKVAFEGEATLGRGKCQLKQASWDDGTCTWGCICTACDAHLEHETGYGYNFCPICGAKVVTE